MKTISRILISGFLFICLSAMAQEHNRTITLKATGNFTAAGLSESAAILTSRLKELGKNPDVRIKDATGEIVINAALTDGKPCNQLLTGRGDISFYETILPGNGSEKICSGKEDKRIADSLVTVLAKNNISNYKLAWSIPGSKSLTCLYALKISPAITKDDLKSVTAAPESGGNNYRILLEFSPAASKTWSGMTRESIGRPVAIVLDNKVIFDPVVRDEMKGGKCEITGTFTKEESDCLVAILRNKTLPLSFTIE